MRIAFLCKRRYMSKDVILDRYARLYEIPRQLAMLGHEVRGWCLDYHSGEDGSWNHDGGSGSLLWESRSLGPLYAPALFAYPGRMLCLLREFGPDLVIGASDIPHVALTRWLATRLGLPYMIDLYDNFEGFGQARIPGFVPALRWGTHSACLVTTTSEPLRRLVVDEYGVDAGKVIAMPSSVDKSVFSATDRAAARRELNLPANAKLMGTAGGLYRDKGVAPLYAAWERISATRPDVHLVLAGPFRPDLPPPEGQRVHYLGHLEHASVAKLFSALDVGVVSVLDTEFGRYCFPQKAYEMLACGLPVVAADVGAMSELFADRPASLFVPGDPDSLVASLNRQLDAPVGVTVPIDDWQALIGTIAPCLEECIKLSSVDR